MKSQIQPRLTLIGAGPGDPDLITVKGLKKLAEADVVLYDALVNTSLLRYSPANSIKIFVGKRAGNHRKTQEEINDLIVNLAYKHGHVVRLKGGDPFIFGRGFEEVSHAVNHLIPSEVVPGISSSTGVSALHNLPLTLRGHSEGFWVLTGTTSGKQLSRDIKTACASSATVVILMGMQKLSHITKIYKSAGKNDAPVMIIQNGSMKNERSVVGTIDSIEKIAIRRGLKSPAVIFIGEVVRVAEHIMRLNEEIKNLLIPEKPEIKGEFSKMKLKDHVPEQLIPRIS
jgi:uroporphyrin-III C-methyltransferase